MQLLQRRRIAACSTQYIRVGVTYSLSYSSEIGDFVIKDKAWNALITWMSPQDFHLPLQVCPPLRTRFFAQVPYKELALQS